jgi:hypothetical protein
VLQQYHYEFNGLSDPLTSWRNCIALSGPVTIAIQHNMDEITHLEDPHEG